MSSIAPAHTLTFNYNDHPIRVVTTRAGTAHFIVKDVQRALGYCAKATGIFQYAPENYTRRVSHTDPQDHGFTNMEDSRGHIVQHATITPAGLLNALPHSRKPEAPAFTDWLNTTCLEGLLGYLAEHVDVSTNHVTEHATVTPVALDALRKAQGERDTFRKMYLDAVAHLKKCQVESSQHDDELEALTAALDYVRRTVALQDKYLANLRKELASRKTSVVDLRRQVQAMDTRRREAEEDLAAVTALSDLRMTQLTQANERLEMYASLDAPEDQPIALELVREHVEREAQPQPNVLQRALRMVRGRK